jgi:hypothetical protein
MVLSQSLSIGVGLFASKPDRGLGVDACLRLLKLIIMETQKL